MLRIGRKTTPLWPLAKGEVERQNRSLLKCLQLARAEKKNWLSELATWLTEYPSIATPQVATGTTPFSLMFGREMRSKLPELKRESINLFKEEVGERVWSNNLKGKVYANEKRGAVSKSMNIGDEVLLRTAKSDRVSSNFCPSLFNAVQKTEEVRSQSRMTQE